MRTATNLLIASAIVLTFAASGNAQRTRSLKAKALPSDVLDAVSKAPKLSRYEVTYPNKTFVGNILKTDLLIFQPDADLLFEPLGEKYLIVVADKLIFQRNGGRDGDHRVGAPKTDNHAGAIETLVDGVSGSNGNPGWEGMKETGRHGGHGSPGGNGTEGQTIHMPTVFFIAFSIEDISNPQRKDFYMSFDFDGIRGGNGGDGGDGGRGGKGERGVPATSTLVECKSGPGWGGNGGDGAPGGNGGNAAAGGNGSHIVLGGSLEFRTASRAFKLSNLGAKAGKFGVAGKGGEAGRYGEVGAVDGLCGIAPRNGKPGKLAPGGKPGKSSALKGKDGPIEEATLNRADFFTN